jgi:hypothetical protein
MAFGACVGMRVRVCAGACASIGDVSPARQGRQQRQRSAPAANRACEVIMKVACSSLLRIPAIVVTRNPLYRFPSSHTEQPPRPCDSQAIDSPRLRVPAAICDSHCHHRSVTGCESMPCPHVRCLSVSLSLCLSLSRCLDVTVSVSVSLSVCGIGVDVGVYLCMRACQGGCSCACVCARVCSCVCVPCMSVCVVRECELLWALVCD